MDTAQLLVFVRMAFQDSIQRRSLAGIGWEGRGLFSWNDTGGESGQLDSER